MNKNIVVPYTNKERVKQINNIKVKLMQLDIYNFLRDEDKIAMDNYINFGTFYEAKYEILALSRIMEIYLINDKNKKTYINLRYMK